MKSKKAETGYIYEIDGKVVVNPELKPKPEDYFKDDIAKWYFAMEKWEDNCIPVVNAEITEHPIEGTKEITIFKPVWQIVDFGQKVEHINGEVTKIL